MSLTLSKAVERGMSLACIEYGRGLVSLMFERDLLSCSLEEGLKMVVVDSVVSRRSSASRAREAKIQLPFCGVNNELCWGVKKNGGLYTQCKNKSSEFCGKCSGDIRGRGSANWVDGKGKSPTLYVDYAEKRGIDLEKAKAFAESILSGDVVVKHSEDEVSDSKDIPF